MKFTKKLILILLSLIMIFSLAGCKKKDQGKEDLLFPAYKLENNRKIYGYIDKKGDFIIEAKYTTANRFTEEGLALVEKDGLFGVVNLKGEEILPTEYMRIGNFVDNYFFANKEGILYIVDFQGEAIPIEGDYIRLGDYSDGLFTAFKMDPNLGMRAGYINSKGEVIIDASYNMVYDFYDGKAFVQEREGENFKIINKKNEVLKEIEADEIRPSKQKDLFIFKGKNKKYGVIRLDGEVVLEGEYDIIGDINDQYIVVGKGDISREKYGLISRDKEELLGPEYESIKLLGQGFLAVAKKRSPLGQYDYKILNSDMEAISEGEYLNVGGSEAKFQGDYLSVSDGEKTFLIDKKGKIADKYPQQLGIGEALVFGDISMFILGDEIIYYSSPKDILWQGLDIYKVNDKVSIERVKYKADKGIDIYYPKLVGSVNQVIESNINEQLYRYFISEDHRDYKFYMTRYNIRSKGDIVTIERIITSIAGEELEEEVKKRIFNFNVYDGRFFRIKDIFKEEVDYLGLLNKLVREKIREDNENISLENIKDIDDSQSFEIRDNKLIIYVESSLGGSLDLVEDISIGLEELDEFLDKTSPLLAN